MCWLLNRICICTLNVNIYFKGGNCMGKVLWKDYNHPMIQTKVYHPFFFKNQFSISFFNLHSQKEYVIFMISICDKRSTHWARGKNLSLLYSLQVHYLLLSLLLERCLRDYTTSTKISFVLYLIVQCILPQMIMVW